MAWVQPNTVVVLSNGSAVALPWKDKVKGILATWLLGQAGGGAVADVLFGKVNPSGKLAETFPCRLEDNPSYLDFPGNSESVSYGEGIYIGYRYYDKKRCEVLYPFGYGLSYTSFAYKGIALGASSIRAGDSLEVQVRVKNSGEVAGKEVVQLYVKPAKGAVDRPEKELKGFSKVALQPGEEKQVTFALGRRDFAFYDTSRQDWAVETGTYEILVGGSSRDLPLKADVFVESDTLPLIHANSTVGDWLDHPKAKGIVRELLGRLQVMKRQGLDADKPEMPARIRRRPLLKFVLLEGMSEQEFNALIERANS